MAQNLANFNEALKIDYLPAIREQLNHATVLLDKVQRNSEDVSGKQWQLTVHHRRNSGVGARADGGTLPTAGHQEYKNPYGQVKYNYGRIEVTGPTIKASRDNEGAIVRALNSEIKGVVRDLKKDINFQLFGAGTGVRALVNGDPGTGTTLTVDGPGTMYLSEGMLIDILDPSTGLARANSTGIEIDLVTSDTTVTMSAALDAAVEDNDWVVRSGARAGATVYEMMGLKGIVDDGTYLDTLHNLSRTTYPWWKCTTFTNDDNGGSLRSVTRALMQEAVSAVEKNGGNVGLIVTTYELRDSYIAEIIADKRHVNTMKLDGGWTGVEFNGLAVVADPDCTPNTMYFLDLDHLFIMQMADFDWMDEDGSILTKVSGKDSYEAILFHYAEFATDRARAHTFLRDVE